MPRTTVQSISSRWTDYLPVSDSSFKTELVFVLNSVNNYLIAFFRGQVLVAICDGILYGLGFLIVGLPYALLISFMAVFLTMMSVTYLVLNREKSADFLIETEGEIKKVSWPARKEYVGSAAIVVLVVAVVSMFLHYVDLGLSRLMQAWGVGF